MKVLSPSFRPAPFFVRVPPNFVAALVPNKVELPDVSMQVFVADVVIDTDDSALHTAMSFPPCSHECRRLHIRGLRD